MRHVGSSWTVKVAMCLVGAVGRQTDALGCVEPPARDTGEGTRSYSTISQLGLTVVCNVVTPGIDTTSDLHVLT